MLHIKDDFKAGGPITQVPASWFNAVARFINNLVGGDGIRVTKNNDYSVIELAKNNDPVEAEGRDEDDLEEDEELLDDEEVEEALEEQANPYVTVDEFNEWVQNQPPMIERTELGSSAGVLCTDGSGNLSVKSIGTASGTVAAGDHTHSQYPTTSDMASAIADAISQSGVPQGVLTDQDIGDTVQAHSSNLDALEATLGSGGKVPLSQLTGNIQGHSGDCLVTIGNDGSLDHSGNDAFDVLSELTNKSTVTNHVVTLPFPTWATGATKASVLVGTDADGDLKNVMTLPSAANATWDRMVVCEAAATTLSLKNLRAEDPPSSLQLVAGGSTSTSAQGAAHTVADTGTNVAKGFTLPVVTRVVWTGTALVYFYTTLKFDKYGRLYSLTKEVKVTVDSPVKVTWN